MLLLTFTCIYLNLPYTRCHSRITFPSIYAYPMGKLLCYQHKVLGSRLDFEASLLHYTYFFLNLVDSSVECKGWTHDILVSHSLTLSLMPGLKVTHCSETIKKIRDRELHCLEAMVEIPFTSGPHATPTSKPFDLLVLFVRLGWKWN